MTAYFKKYDHFAWADLFDITDRKREWFDIDTSQPMNYTNEDVEKQGFHAHHGPQPYGEVLNQTWNVELDKYLKGEENNVKSHKFWKDYKYQYTDQGTWPKIDDIESMFKTPFTD